MVSSTTKGIINANGTGVGKTVAALGLGIAATFIFLSKEYVSAAAAAGDDY